MDGWCGLGLILFLLGDQERWGARKEKGSIAGLD